jgi:hypothetical protein
MDIQRQHFLVKQAVKAFNKESKFECHDKEFKTKKEIIYVVVAKIYSIKYSPSKDSYLFDVSVENLDDDGTDKGVFGYRSSAQITTIEYFRSMLYAYGVAKIYFSWNINPEERDYESLPMNEHMKFKIKSLLEQFDCEGGAEDIGLLPLGGQRKKKRETNETDSGSSGSFEAPMGFVKREFDEQWDGAELNHAIKSDDMVVPLDYKKFKQLCHDIIIHIPSARPKIQRLYVELSNADRPNWDAAIKFLMQLVKQANMAIAPHWRLAPNPGMNESEDKWGRDGFDLNNDYHQRIFPQTMKADISGRSFHRLLQDLKQLYPTEYAFIKEKIDAERNSNNTLPLTIVHQIIAFLDGRGIIIGPNLRITPNPELNEGEEDYGTDGAWLDDEDFEDDNNQVFFDMPEKEAIEELLKDVQHYYPVYRQYIDSMRDQFTDENGQTEWDSYFIHILEYLNQMNVTIGPNFRVVPDPDLNEATVSDSSGSYETPGCWATGTGKQSIKNSRAAKSKQFKKALYGGPNAQYVAVKNSVNTLGESVDIYNERSNMKKSQIQKLVEDTIKQEVLKTLNEESKPKKKAIVVKEDTFLKLVDAMISEESHPALTQYKKMHKEEGAIFNKERKVVDKKIGDYADFKGNDKPEYPNAIKKPTAKVGEDGEPIRHKPTPDQEEFIEDFKGKGQEDLVYDLEPDEKFKKRAEMSLKGGSQMGNSGGDDVVGVINNGTQEEMEKKAKRRNKKEKAAPMYKKDVQPTGNTQTEDGESDLKGRALKESTDVLENEMAKIKKLYTYSDRTQ